MRIIPLTLFYEGNPLLRAACLLAMDLISQMGWLGTMQLYSTPLIKRVVIICSFENNHHGNHLILRRSDLLAMDWLVL